MKKLILILVAALLLLITLSFLLIPSSTLLKSELSFRIPYTAVYRELIETNQWNKWWPENGQTKEGNYAMEGTFYSIDNKTVNSIGLTAERNGQKTMSQLLLIPLRQDSVKLVWENIVSCPSYNPFKRIACYFDRDVENKKTDKLLQAFKGFMTDSVKLYGVDIHRDRVVDSFLVSTSRNIDSTPTMDLVYKMVDELKNYIKSKKAKETGYPMLNLSQLDTKQWTVRVAIPVDQKLPSEGNISYKWMLGGGNILTAEIKGGLSTINKALEGMDNYVKDHQLIPPAIPFQSMITDRSKEKDSTRWVTRLFYPVM